MKCCAKELCKLDCKSFFLLGMRFAFGFWLLYVGLYKWIGIGPNNFVGYVTQNFATTWSPEILTIAMSWIILIAEPLCGLWLLIGRCQRVAWLATAKLMFLLLFGQTMLQAPTMMDNWLYFILALLCAAMNSPECYEESAGCQAKS